MNKITVWHIITGLGRGGAEKMLLELCTGLNNEAFESKVICLSSVSDMEPLFIQAGIETHVLHMRKNPVSLIRSISKTLRIFQSSRVDILHAHMTHALIFSVLLLGFNYRLPLVFTPHSIRFGSSFRSFLLWTLRPFRSTDILFSREQKRVFFRNDSVVIPNGIALPATERTLPKFEVFTFLAIGRLEHMKNHRALIPIARKLKEEYDFQILIAGTGTLKKDLERAIEESGLSETIRLLGFREDIKTLCLKSHAFIMPSLWEGFPVSILEAGIARLPVITTPVGSIPSLIDEPTGYTGNVQDFAIFMAQIMDDYDRAKERGNRLFQCIRENYSRDQFLEKHRKIYRELTQKIKSLE